MQWEEQQLQRVEDGLELPVTCRAPASRPAFWPVRSWHGLGSTHWTWQGVLGSHFQKLPESQGSRDLIEMSVSQAFQRQGSGINAQ